MEVEQRTFNPRGILPEEYIMKYPELRENDETRKLKGVELIWCWYFGSKESPFNKKAINHKDKCAAITELVFGNIHKGKFYDDKIIDALYIGNIPQQWMQAVDFFKRTDTLARTHAKSMIDTIFQQYTEIIEKGVEGFRNPDTNEIDYSKYVTTMKKIQDELTTLIRQKEYGFGVSDAWVGDDDAINEGSYWAEMYLKSK